MKPSICGADCTQCPGQSTCPGCAETNGCPSGKPCWIAKLIRLGGMESYLSLKKALLEEFNSLAIPGMGEVQELYPLVGRFVNLAYPLPSGQAVPFLKDDEMYLGNQVECIFDDSHTACFGLLASTGFLMVCEYGENGTHPELVVFRRR